MCRACQLYALTFTNPINFLSVNWLNYGSQLEMFFCCMDIKHPVDTGNCFVVCLQYVDYVSKVLMPEMVVKIVMDLRGLQHGEAEQHIHRAW